MHECWRVAKGLLNLLFIFKTKIIVSENNCCAWFPSNFRQLGLPRLWCWRKIDGRISEGLSNIPFGIFKTRTVVSKNNCNACFSLEYMPPESPSIRSSSAWMVVEIRVSDNQVFPEFLFQNISLWQFFGKKHLTSETIPKIYLSFFVVLALFWNATNGRGNGFESQHKLVSYDCQKLPQNTVLQTPKSTLSFEYVEPHYVHSWLVKPWIRVRD